MHDPSWDELVLSHPDATFFHGSAWARVLHESYNFAPVYLLATEPSGAGVPPANDSRAGCQPDKPGSARVPPAVQLSTLNPALSTLSGSHRLPVSASPRLASLLALLPVMAVNSPLTGRRGVSLPFTDACPPLISDAVPLPALLHELTELAKAHRWKYWECRGLKELPAGAAPSLSFYGHTLDLSLGEKALFDHFKSTLRTAIRKAEQAGVETVASNTLEAVQTFYALHCQTRRKHGVPPQPFRFFRSIHRHILSRDLGQVVIARTQKRPIAANVYFHSGTKAIYKYGASDDAFQEMRGSNLVMWSAIKDYARQGYASLHFGRTSITGEGLRRFKLGWGAREERIDYLRYHCREARFVSTKDEAFGWHNSLMTRMPVIFLRTIGAALYPHMG